MHENITRVRASEREWTSDCGFADGDSFLYFLSFFFNRFG